MPGDVYCTGCDAFRDRTELGRCIDGVYVSCEMCEDYHELLAEWEKVNEEFRALKARLGEPDAFCDPCGGPMWEALGDSTGSTIAYGIETVACEKCRGAK